VAAKPAGDAVESGDSIEFLEHLKVDLFPDEVYVFTPKGRSWLCRTAPPAWICLRGAHGHRQPLRAAKINHELVPLRTELKSGDRVEIITAAHANPNRRGSIT